MLAQQFLILPQGDEYRNSVMERQCINKSREDENEKPEDRVK